MRFLNPFTYFRRRRYRKACEQIGYLVIEKMDESRGFRRKLNSVAPDLAEKIDVIQYKTVNKK